MQRQVLLAVAFLALLASARADEAEEPKLLGSVQGYMEQAAKTVQNALTSVQKLEVAQQARGWMDGGISSLKDYWSTFTDKFTGFWEYTEEALPTSASAI